MKFQFAVVATFLFPLLGNTVAQEAGLAQPNKQHEVLKKLAGQWTTTGKGVAAEGQPVMETKGTINSRMLGGFWVVSEMSASMGDTKFQAVQTVGYDPKKQKYVGTWVDSVMNHMWQYNGHYDADSDKLILEAEGPSFQPGGKLAKYRDVYEFKTPDLIVTTSEVQQDGKWVPFMTGEARRVKEHK